MYRPVNESCNIQFHLTLVYLCRYTIALLSTGSSVHTENLCSDIQGKVYEHHRIRSICLEHRNKHFLLRPFSCSKNFPRGAEFSLVLGSFSTRRNFPRGMIFFFCLLTPTLHQLVFKQKKMSLRAENSA